MKTHGVNFKDSNEPKTGLQHRANDEASIVRSTGQNFIRLSGSAQFTVVAILVILLYNDRATLASDIIMSNNINLDVHRAVAENSEDRKVLVPLSKNTKTSDSNVCYPEGVKQFDVTLTGVDSTQGFALKLIHSSEIEGYQEMMEGE